MLPHDKTDGKRTPGFFISTSNMTYLNIKGKDLKSSRWGNPNASSGWKNRMEYGVTASKGVTKLSLIMNTSVILPPVSWNIPIFGEISPKKQHSRSKSSRRSSSSSSGSHSGSRSNSSRSSHSNRGSRESGHSRREETPERPPPRIKEKEPRHKIRPIEERDHRQRHAKERRKRRPNVDPGFIDNVDPM
ncbi:hypothetical protein ONS95_009067 [Cadophora gregata]|uniref:uncharacterized protein n=1 Tax=Cadophora gregata TaxID=51156 RepID=UPI0026DC04ED|nr:uncharacterized protein ONS95_009067 [Cadophora gregata]KAK0124081.1 hypothetical protein ONS95_009067 [Cadophora gregata]